jgi:hypothetical protein
LNITVPTSVSRSGNWSGYVITPGSSVNAVGGTWIQPAVTAGVGNAMSSTWVGIDGWGSPTVEQIGTEADITNGKPSYYAWYEMYPASEIRIPNFSVSPGDTISAQVYYISSSGATSTFGLRIYDATKNELASETATITSAQRNSGEWIEEAPSLNNVVQRLANFGKVNFSGAWATVGSITGAINDFPGNQAVNMYDANGGYAITSNPPSDSTNLGWNAPDYGSSSFSVTYSATPPPSSPEQLPMLADSMDDFFAQAPGLENWTIAGEGRHQDRVEFHDWSEGERGLSKSLTHQHASPRLAPSPLDALLDGSTALGDAAADSYFLNSFPGPFGVHGTNHRP